MLLRAGSAGSNTFTDHEEVLAAALKQVPAAFRRRVLVRIDGAGASHKLIEHMLTLTSARKALLFTCGWTILDADEEAIAALPASAWEPGLRQDGGTEDDKDVAEVTHLMSRAEIWPEGLRFNRPAGEAVSPAQEEHDRLREEFRMEVLHHLHKYPAGRDRRGSRQPPPAVHRRGPAGPRHRRDRRRPHGEGHGASEPCPRPADQRQLPQQHERRRIPAAWKPVPPRARRAAPRATSQNQNGHETPKPAPARKGTSDRLPDSLRLAPGLRPDSPSES
jgi:hypothetical protein